MNLEAYLKKVGEHAESVTEFGQAMSESKALDTASWARLSVERTELLGVTVDNPNMNLTPEVINKISNSRRELEASKKILDSVRNRFNL